jgi:hypothetical protein
MPLTNGDAPPGIGTLMVGGVAPLVNGDNGGWTGTLPLTKKPIQPWVDSTLDVSICISRKMDSRPNLFGT